jgi:DNA helicase-2/ATP-dependent DNA helicase PcrA
MTEFRPRSAQREVLAYTGGMLGIAAVPGSGKTHTLAELAAKLVADGIREDQEVLVVTLVNSAVDNFKLRINGAIKRRRLLPNFGYRVRTLHGLSHDIVRERPGLVGLADDFGIIDEREADSVRGDAVDAWLTANPDAADAYLSPDVEGNQAAWVKRARWPGLVRSLAAAYIKRAKDLELTPEGLLECLRPASGQLYGQPDRLSLPLARMGAQIYADYQHSLAYRGVVDFDDLIRLALVALQGDPEYLARLQHRWPYVLEDEAQDSSQLQEKILRLLAADPGNWVRVGDPNQAIYDTFTTADPEFLRQFLLEDGVSAVNLLESGRSQPAIIELANLLVDWTATEHPNRPVRKALAKQHIVPTSPGDPQPNPAADYRAVHLIDRDYTPEQELQAVAKSLQAWLPEHEEQTAAVLVPRNKRGFDLSEVLKRRGVPYVELLRSSSITRETAGALGNLLRCLSDPASAKRLSVAFQVWRRADRDEPDAKALMNAVAKRIAGCPAVESYLWPRADHDWLALSLQDLPDAERELLTGFRAVIRRWHRAASLPIDQLVLTLANDLFFEPSELALAQKLAGLLRDVAQSNPSYRLPELVEELAVIARNERRFLGFSGEDSGFDPPKGKVTIATMHKAKGLEWDRVYLLSVNNYTFPSGSPHDTYISERRFVRDGLNLEAEALGQLAALAARRDGDRAAATRHSEGEATHEARLEYVAERLRLLYVGITRARQDLFLTWNTGRRRTDKLVPAVAFIALHDKWKAHNGGEPDAG